MGLSAGLLIGLPQGRQLSENNTRFELIYLRLELILQNVKTT